MIEFGTIEYDPTYESNEASNEEPITITEPYSTLTNDRELEVFYSMSNGDSGSAVFTLKEGLNEGLIITAVNYEGNTVSLELESIRI